jgi:hypothetical protein
MTRLVITLALLLAASPAAADALDDLALSVAKFRGVGYDDVGSYRVELEIPEEGEESVPLEEIWRAPRDLALRAARPNTPAAIVRSLALYLEPLYVARASLLDADLSAHIDRLRAGARVETQAAGALTCIVVEFPDDPAAAGLEAFQDVARLRADLDEYSRMHRLEILLREEKSALTLECDFKEGGAFPQPDRAVWTLPNGDHVEIDTVFREQEGRSVPASRLIVFPSRYDPGEREEILVRYGTYAFDAEVSSELLAESGSFRYDADGLVSE